jgi:hypothetical protein
MPNGKKVKQAVKRGFTNAKRELGPQIKAMARSAVQAAKNELKTHGKRIAKDALKIGAATMFGMGDYRTNNLIKGGINQAPSFGSTSTTFRRRECLGTVVSSSTIGKFKIDKFRVNPALAATFPWLSLSANNYESYRPISLVFEYVPTSGMSVASGDTSLGSVTMASQYNPYATDPQNLIQIQGYPDAVAFAPYEHALCGIECKPSKRQADTLLLRNSNVTSQGGLSINNGFDTLFDLCEFFIATEGCQVANVKLGQLWVTYEVQLLNPIIPQSLPYNPGLTLKSTAASTTQLFFNNAAASQWSFGAPISFTKIDDSINLVSLPPGDYIVSLGVRYSTTQTYTVNVAVTGTAGSSMLGSNWYAPQPGASANNVYFEFRLTVPSDGTTNIDYALGPSVPIDYMSWNLWRYPSQLTSVILPLA